ncbi:MAG TPA: hypothetical protein VK890_07570 [Bacteroidia bacterium]|nr:hypothetical protein [Bacteroidia bacterium]
MDFYVAPKNILIILFFIYPFYVFAQKNKLVQKQPDSTAEDKFIANVTRMESDSNFIGDDYFCVDKNFKLLDSVTIKIHSKEKGWLNYITNRNGTCRVNSGRFDSVFVLEKNGQPMKSILSGSSSSYQYDSTLRNSSYTIYIPDMSKRIKKKGVRIVPYDK